MGQAALSMAASPPPSRGRNRPRPPVPETAPSRNLRVRKPRGQVAPVHTPSNIPPDQSMADTSGASALTTPVVAIPEKPRNGKKPATQHFRLLCQQLPADVGGLQV